MTLLFSCLNAFAADTPKLHWEFAGWYGGGCYPFLAVDPHNEGRVYVTSDVAGLWRSDERGAEWKFATQSLSNLNVATLAISDSNPDILYAGTGTGIEKSDNGGRSWKFLQSTEGKIVFGRPESYKAIAVDNHDSNKIYAGSHSGEIFYSSDGGGNWSVILKSKEVLPISSLYLARDGKFLFAGSSQGLVRFNVSSSAWEKILDGKVYDIAAYGPDETIFATCGTRIGWTRDFGKSWSYSKNIPLTTGEITRIAVTKNKSGQTLLLAAWMYEWSGGIFSSSDDGQTWTSLDRNLEPDRVGDPTRSWTQGFGRLCAIAFDPFDPEVIYFSDWWGIWRSDDGGKNWKERIRGAPNTVVSDVQIAGNGDVFVATMDNGLLRSRDGGLSYEALCPRLPHHQQVKGHVWRVLPMDEQADMILATNTPWNGEPNQIVFSKDGGLSFFLSRRGLPVKNPDVNTVWGTGYPRALARDPQDPARVFLGIDGDDGGGFFVSEDWGYSWTRSEGQPDSLRIYNGLAVDPAAPNRIYWGAAGKENGGVYRTEDSGKTWRRVFSEAGWIFDLAVSKEGAVYAVADFGGPALYVSYDQGNHWGLLKKFGARGSLDAIAIDPKDSGRIAVSSVQWNGDAGGKIFFSDDGGKNWQDITADLPWGTGAAAMAFAPDGTLYAGRYAGSVYKLSAAR